MSQYDKIFGNYFPPISEGFKILELGIIVLEHVFPFTKKMI